MSDTLPDRQLTELERQAFQRLGLTPGHWAALAPAPLFHQPGVRSPNRHTAADLEATNQLRLALRTLPDLSPEAGHFWDRLGAVSLRAEAALATRLLAWHLATDAPFARRVGFFHLLRQTAEHFTGAHGPRRPDPVYLFRGLVDGYLPCPAFDPNTGPARVTIPAPAPAALDALADTILFPLVTHWPPAGAHDALRIVPSVAAVLGEPREWWGARDPARVAVERGLAGRSFDERQRVHSAVFAEWIRAVELSFPWAVAKEQAERLVNRMWEWADAVRFAARAVGPVAEPAPLLTAADNEPAAAPPTALAVREIPAEFVPLPAAPRAAPPLPPTENPKPERGPATTASPFTTVPFGAALARARTTSVAEVCAWIDSGPRLLFDDHRDGASHAVAVVKDASAVPADLWIVGDLHADVLALANIIHFTESQAAPGRAPHYLFLGDFVDRGIHDHELLLLLFGLMMAHPGRVCVVPGNHDVDLQFDGSAQRFKVTIEPAEYCDALNAARARGAREDRARVELARAFVRFCAGRPRAVFLPDGTLVAHGGFPHTDAQKDIATLSDLCSARCLDDFLWARIAETARVKRPNRGSRGHEFGWDTLVQFAKLAGERMELPVRRLVRGHDHVPDRWQEYPEYAANGVPVLTLNAMGRALDGDPPRRDGTRHPLPVVGRYVPDQLPEVVVLPLDPTEVERALGRADPEEPCAMKSARGAGGAP